MSASVEDEMFKNMRVIVWKPVSTPIWDAANESVNNAILSTIWQGIRNPVEIFVKYSVEEFTWNHTRNFDKIR